MERINKQEVYNFVSRKNKWLGLIDYKTLLVFGIYSYLVIKFVFFLDITHILRLYIITIFISPFVIFIILNLNEECIVDKLFVILKFLSKRKIYIKMENYAKLDKIYVNNVEKKCIEKNKDE